MWKFWFLKVSDLQKRWEARSPSNPEIHELWIERENMARTIEFLTHFNLRKLHIPNFSNLTGGKLHCYLNCNHLVFFQLKSIFPPVVVFQDAFLWFALGNDGNLKKIMLWRKIGYNFWLQVKAKIFWKPPFQYPLFC